MIFFQIPVHWKNQLGLMKLEGCGLKVQRFQIPNWNWGEHTKLCGGTMILDKFLSHSVEKRKILFLWFPHCVRHFLVYPNIEKEQLLCGFFDFFRYFCGRMDKSSKQLFVYIGNILDWWSSEGFQRFQKPYHANWSWQDYSKWILNGTTYDFR